MGYDQAFFERLKGLRSDPDWDLAFTRPPLDFESLGLLPSHCHPNVERWVETHPDWKRIRGWLISPFDGGLGFAAHSLALGPDGELWDVTPYLALWVRDLASTFIRHTGSDEQFDRGVIEHWGIEGYLYDSSQAPEPTGDLWDPYSDPEDGGDS